MSYFLPPPLSRFLSFNFGIFKDRSKVLMNGINTCWFNCRTLLFCSAIILVPLTAFEAQPSQKKLDKTSVVDGDIYKSAIFLENRDIVPPHNGERVLYYVKNNHLNAFFTEKGVIYQLTTVDTNRLNEFKKEQGDEKGEKDEDEAEEDRKPTPIINSVIEMQWIGANPHPQVEASAKSEGYYTYLKHDGNSYKTLVTEGYKNLVYKNLYPGIDAEYIFPDKGGVEYSLIVHPGADPDLVKMVYNGDVLSVSKNITGDIIVHTNGGDLTEHAPACFTPSAKVPSQFSITGNVIQFNLLSAFNHQETLTIDPWITVISTMPPTNVGMKVDYDYLGNLFVYGPGPTDVYDVNDFFSVAKYSSTGTFLWAFAGSVPGIWNSAESALGYSYNYQGGFRVDRITGKQYESQGFNYNGTQTIRLTSAGQYDNFISTVNANFREAWGIMYNCSTETIMDVGGGTIGNINIGIINTANASVTPSNITGIGGAYQDIICATYDSAGNMYVVMNDGLGTLPFTNTLYQVNAGYNGNNWSANSNFTVFNESANVPYWGASSGNWSNSLAANGNYLFYYDGYNVAAYSLSSGAPVGTATTIAGYTPLMQGGIAVDRCNNIYLGGVGVIKTFNFNGSTFVPGADISLGGAYTSNAIYDVALNTTTNKLYVAGTVVGTFIATPSITCTAPKNFAVSFTHTCGSALVHVSPTAALSPPDFTYILFDTSYNIVSQQTSIPDTLYNFTGLNDGKYYIQVQWNANCGGETVNDTITLRCDSISPDTSICKGDSVVISAHCKPGGGTFTWTPGGSTDSILTVSPIDTTVYTVTYVPPTGPTYVDSVTVFILPFATVTVTDTSICQGDTATLRALPSIGGGTYLWQPGGYADSSITVSPSTTTSYQVTYNFRCNVPVGAGTVTVQPKLLLATFNDTICQGSIANILVTPSVPGGTYTWAPGGANTQAINVAPFVAGPYTYTVTYAQGLCQVTDSSTVVVDSFPILSIANDTICQGSMATLTSITSLTGGTYTWTPGNYSTATISVNPLNTLLYGLSYNVGVCTAVDSALVVVDSMPVLTMTGDSICITNSGQVSVSPSLTGGTYLWSTGDSTASITYSPLITTTYSVAYTSLLCSVSGSATIVVLPQPTVSVTGDTVCSGTPVLLTATVSKGGGTYTWTPGGFQTDTATVSPLTTTTYTVVYTIAGCGTAIDSATVKDWQYPTLITSDTALCNGDVGQVAAIGSIPGGNYLWTPGGMVSSAITVSPDTTKVYTVTYEVHNCAVTDSSTVIIHYNPTLGILGANATCGLSNGSETALPAGGNPPYNYVWSTGANSVSINQLSGNLTYQVSIQDIYQCSASASAFIHQSSAVAAWASGINEKCPGYHNAFAFVADTGGITPYTYAWSIGQSTDTIYSLFPDVYTVTVTDTTGCSISASVTVLDAVPDSFGFATQPTSCYGDQYQDGSLTVSPLNMLRMPYQYTLGGGTTQNNGSYSNLAYGSYNVIVVDDSGCVNHIKDIVIMEAAEGILTILPTDTTITLGQTVQLTEMLVPYGNDSINTYSWSPYTGLSCIDCAAPVVSTYAASTTYTLTITYNGHCIVSNTAIVNITGELPVFIPDVFTPNGDGNNDVFYVYGTNIMTVDLKVFNRWGELVFEGHNQFDGWDGRYKGEPQPLGVYIYEANIRSLDGQTVFRKGSVTLVR